MKFQTPPETTREKSNSVVPKSARDVSLTLTETPARLPRRSGGAVGHEEGTPELDHSLSALGLEEGDVVQSDDHRFNLRPVQQGVRKAGTVVRNVVANRKKYLFRFGDFCRNKNVVILSNSFRRSAGYGLTPSAFWRLNKGRK